MRTIIVGGGISGLATAHALLHRDPGRELLVLEADARPGGKVMTERFDGGWLCEWGVNGFLNNKPATLTLAEQLAIEPLVSYDASRRRFVWRHGALHALPESPPAFLTSKLMSLPGRLRVLAEPFIPRARAEDETLFAFAARRLGREAAEALIDPMAQGVFAGNSQRMSLKSCFPRIHEIEQQYGSLIRGLISLQRKARREGAKDRPGPSPGGKLTSFEGGMGDMIDALAAELGDRLRTGTPVEGVGRGPRGYVVDVDGATLEADQLILAVPAWALSRLLRDMAPEVARLVAEIPYPALSVVCMGYAPGRLEDPLGGFGFLVPPAEGRRVLGTVVDSAVFPNRAPEGGVLLRTMVGGARRPELAMLPDEQLVDTVRAELADVLGVDRDPDFVALWRHERAIPQYLVGHAARLEQIDHALAAFPGLHLTGNAFRGVSLNDCVANAEALAETLA